MTTSADYSDFTLSLAFVDAIPVLLFCISGILIARKFTNKLFTAGIVFCCAAGLGKVIWKLLLALMHHDYHFLNTQFRFLMPLGFVLLVVSVIICRKTIAWHALFASLIGMPQVIFFALGIIGMCIMSAFAVKLDDSVRSNWIEQGTNSIAQLMFLLGIIFIK